MCENQGVMETKPHKRKHWLIYPSFQFALIRGTTAVLAVCILASIIAVRLSFSRLHLLARQTSWVQKHTYTELLLYQERQLYLWLFMGAIVAVILSYVITLIISQRLAGPVRRLKRHFEKTGDSGEWSPLEFRKYDYFQELPGIVNSAIRRLRNNRGDAQK